MPFVPSVAWQDKTESVRSGATVGTSTKCEVLVLGGKVLVLRGFSHRCDLNKLDFIV